MIPASISELEANYIVADSTLSAPLFDFMWNATVEEGREKRLMHQSFTRYPEEVAVNLGLSSDSISIAETTLKVSMLLMPTKRKSSRRLPDGFGNTS